MQRPFYLQTDYRVASGGISAYGKNASSVPYLVDGVSHGTAAEAGGQTGHCWGMSEASTVVNIVGAHHRSDKFLDNIVILVGGSGRGHSRKLLTFIGSQFAGH